MTKVPEDLNALYETVCTSENPDAVTLIDLIERISRLKATNKALCEALEKLVAKLDVVIPLVDGYVALHTIRTGVSYDGPTIVEEMTAARAAIEQAKEQTDGK